ncbi:hypothetical protein B4064_1654 [Caldibacillus thermoamylovorans]|jgi:hypothetical protein|uniref:hypothetical protein n=1 Tax=Bacillaceae TaxID=186817 RepID=UPI0005A42979|nr:MULTISPECIES: hypothetical protein [Bacillaceae]KIO68728.1 hypothetical protein B4064_1654 [Caldibacillus thermoamylovorans]MEC2306454.1 hypothetical protein [Weizmannia sp. CD-2023]MEC2340075.1 hypothetical protein [Weizmannia sp. CD-2023]
MSNQFYCYLLRLNEYDRKIRLSDSLAVSLNEFQERWNSYAVEFNYPYSDLEISIDNRILNIKLKGNKNIAFLGDIIEYDNEKILKSINMIASGDGSTQSGANIIIAISILIACLNPQEDVEFRNNIFRDLGLLDIKFGTKSAIIVNDFKYAVNFTKELGLWFSISRK